MLIITMGFMPTGVSYASCLSGTTATGYYTLAAQRLVNNGLTSGTSGTQFNNVIIRLAHEFNGTWYPWKVTHTNSQTQYSDIPSNFVALWQVAVNAMRAVAPNLKFCWNGAAGQWSPYSVADCYPGDDYVDYVGADAYDQSWATNSYPYTTSTYSYGSDAATRQKNAWNYWIYGTNEAGILTWQNIAVAHNKPFSIPEWGLTSRSDGHGGLDNTYYVQQMYNFIQDPANNVVFHSYFDVNAPDGGHQITPFPAAGPTAFPYGAALFRKLFGLSPFTFESDIGTVGISGSSDPVTVYGAGAGCLTGTADNFHYSARPLSGDGRFTAEITSMPSDPLAQSGIMLRQNVTADAPYAALFLANGQCFFQSRTSAGAAAVKGGVIVAPALPIWLKMVRQGNVITGYQSSDGYNWSCVGTGSIAMTGTNYAGVAASSGSTTGLNATGIDLVNNYNFNVANSGDVDNAIIKDNTDTSGITKTGSWQSYTDVSGYYGSDYLFLYHGSPLSTVKYSPTVPATGQYDVFMRWPVDSQRSTNVLTKITSTSGTTQLYCNQYLNGYLWNYLGTFNFAAGTTGNVFISSTNVDGYAATADSVMFVPVPTTFPPAISSTSSATGNSGLPFNYQISASNSPTGYAATGLPSGLNVDPVAGLISGTPAMTGTFNSTISAINSAGTNTATLTTTIKLGPPNITGSLNITATNGSPLSYQITAINNPTGYTASSLPAGLALGGSSGLISGTPTMAGTTSVTIGTLNASGSASATLTINILAPYDAWKTRMFSPSELLVPGISSDTANPSGDGIANMMKYALNLDPHVAGRNGLPVGGTSSVSGSNYLTLTYTKLIYANDISYVVEVSGDLAVWHSGGSYTTALSATNNPDGITQQVVVRDLTPMGATGNRFIRLKVTKP